jgi:SulP family sulfate permease
MKAISQALPPKKHLVNDVLAGFTFAVVNIPTAMAHALLANVNPTQGIYSLMFATPTAAIFTSSIYMNVSTTSALAVAAGSALIGFPSNQRLSALVILVLLVGAIELLLGLLRLGSMVRFVPNSVMVGFVNGVAVLIILGQVSDLTGFSSEYSNKVARMLDTILHYTKTDYRSLVTGLFTIGLILLLNRTRLRKISAILGLVAATALVLLFQWTNVAVVGDVTTLPSSLPLPVLPDFKLISGLLIPALSISLIGLIQGAGVSQSIPNPDGKFPDISRDFVGQGIANIVTGFFQGVPAGGSMSGTVLNLNSGAKTRWVNIFVELIPMPALAGLVMLAGFQAFRLPDAVTVYMSGVVSATAMGLTFLGTLIIPLQYAVLIGVAFSILLHAFRSANKVEVVQVVPVEGGLPEEAPPPVQLPSDRTTILMIFGSVFFAAASAVEEKLPGVDETRHAVVIITLRGHTDVGSTFINVLERYDLALQAHGSKLMLAGVSPELMELLRRTGVLDQLGEASVFPATHQFGASVNMALEASQVWLGQPEPPPLVGWTEVH